MRNLILIFALISSICGIPYPEQIHSALGEVDGEYWINWATLEPAPNSMVYYRQIGLSNWNKVDGKVRDFRDGGFEHRHIYLNLAKLQNLEPNATYEYLVGSLSAVSDIFELKTLPHGSNWSPKLLVFGDMGVENARSLETMEIESMRGAFDLVLHVGDFAYDMASENARRADQFMREIEPIASRIPYMTCPGNHENQYNFSNYRYRFPMPTDELGERMFYSFNVGPLHIISISTEFYYYIYYGLAQISRQFEWLEQDLKNVNRSQHPWVMLLGHRPMYCSNTDYQHCTHVDNFVRVGFPHFQTTPPFIQFRHGMEALLYRYEVDLAIFAHEHSYERMWPVYNRTVCNGTESRATKLGEAANLVDSPVYEYINPPAPIHIVTGAAGNREGENKFYPDYFPWTAFRAMDYGFTRIHVLNSTHLDVRQESIDKSGATIDHFLLIKTRRGNFDCAAH